MFLHYSPFWLKALYPRYVWHVPSVEKKIFLTFDDGPIPVITKYVSDELEKFGAKATFFCIGDNVRKHPDMFEMLLENGHSIGNHTFNHMNGWKTENQAYIDNIRKCEVQLSITTNLFRPPYGRMKHSQGKLLDENTQIIMWDVLSGDFSPSISREICLQKSIKHTRPGSIILFHDSLKAAKNMQFTLPRYLEYFSQKGFSFEAMPMC